MRFQNKLLYTYSFLIVFLVLVLALLFQGYSSKLFESNATGTYDLLCTRLGQQIDNIIRPMDFVSTNLISDASFKSALALLGTLDRNDPVNSYYVTDAMQTVRRLLSSYSIYKNFYAVVVFNRKGDFFSSNFLDHADTSISQKVISELPWLQRATLAAGHAVAVAPYMDPWQAGGSNAVFSRARIVPGLDEDLGYIEVQNRHEELEIVLAVPQMEFVRILVFQPDGEPFYQSDAISRELLGHYRSESSRPDRAAGFHRNPVTGEYEFISATTSTYSGLTVALVLNRRVLLSPLRFMRLASLGIGFLIILFSVMFTWFSSKQLTKPLKMIQERMEKTELSNLPMGSPLEHPNDEIVALDRTFRNLASRLDEAVRLELHSRTLWMQARLDSLQSQVNPHFMNNILTVIANRGLESGDEMIGDICQGVASMLRYSTSTQERAATIGQELDHVRTYLFLMKQRLEDRLSYLIDVDPAILGTLVPKIILHQIIENSINHGYRSSPRPISIRIRGYASGSHWCVEMIDNGDGFEKGKLEELNEKICMAGIRMKAGTEGQGFGLGGLGLINTYSRLFLFYRGDVIWNIENQESGGVRVLVGGPLKFAVAEADHAEDPDRRG